VDVTTLDYGISAMTLLINREIGLKDIIDSVIPQRDNGLSAGDYALIFIMNRLPKEWYIGMVEGKFLLNHLRQGDITIILEHDGKNRIRGHKRHHE